jgi:hypothetical protein
MESGMPDHPPALEQYSPIREDEQIDHARTPGDYDSLSEGEDGDNDEEVGSDDDTAGPGSLYDAEAARAQAERLAQRKRDREVLEREE